MSTPASLLPDGFVPPCTADPESWFATDTATIRKVKAICETCPIHERCRQVGRDGNEWGVWGAETKRGRRGRSRS
ncbi:WhiB family transcriptional regulator [Streptoverticillium reticulum]|uniref:WhiB family transcriptional regulator n=1 Tax=Streptoverticillium reticulum TaxID=1433415 RepID=UPI0039BEE966